MRALLVALAVAVLSVAPAPAEAACAVPDPRSTAEVVGADGGPARVVAEQRTCSGGLVRPAFTPDGSGIHAVSLRPTATDPTSVLVHVPTDGRPARDIAPVPDASEPVVSPDGRHVGGLELRGVVVRRVADRRVVARLGGRYDDLAEFYGEDSPVAWSPDGRRFAAVLHRVPSGSALVVVDVPSGRVLVRRRFGHVELARGAFAPGGDALTVTLSRDYVSGAPSRAATLDLRTRRVHVHARWARTPPYGGVVRHPDGRRLVWTSDRSVVVAAPTGRRVLGVRSLGRGVRVASEAAVSPDGRQAALVVAADGEDFAATGLAVVDLASGTVRLLVPFRERGVADPAWSPDGTQIAFAG